MWRAERWDSTNFLLYIQPRTPPHTHTHWIVLPTFRVGLPFSANPRYTLTDMTRYILLGDSKSSPADDATNMQPASKKTLIHKATLVANA